MEEILNLNRIDILAAGDDDILLAIHQIVKSVFILLGHVSGIQPAVLRQNLRCCFGIFVIFDHDRRPANCKLTHLTLLLFLPALIDDLCLPAESRNADSTHLVDILHAEVHTARSQRL